MNQDNQANLPRTRPLSPHLTIYKPQITSILSIMHRITGFALYFGLLALVWWIVACIYCKNPESLFKCACFSSLIWKLFIFGWSASLFYHTLNGIRHLFWDAGYGFSICATNRSGWLVIIGTAALTFVSWMIVYTN
jgi:succinate dehydrogenase / fumarate reductase cytochrome b subunit